MGEPGDAGRASGIEELEYEPEDEEKGGRDIGKGDEYENKDQGADPGPGIENQVGPHHAGYGSTGPDDGHERIEVE